MLSKNPLLFKSSNVISIGNFFNRYFEHNFIHKDKEIMNLREMRY